MQTNSLEFHYLVSYHPDEGWQIPVDTEDVKFPEGTIYNWETNEWFYAYEDSNDPENSSIADLDTAHYRVLKSALLELNEKEGR